MKTTIREYANTSRRHVRIDREGGVLHDVKIIGCESRNGRSYPNETLKEAVPLYENSKVNLDHPEGNPGKPRSYQDRFGVIRNVRLRENEGIFADFRFNPKHAIAEQLLWDAENAPENVGFSHNVEAIVRRERDGVIVEKILSVRSVDLVADPATTSGLFESVDASTETAPVAETTGGEPTDGDRPDLMLLCEALLRTCSEAVPAVKTLIDESFLETLSMASDRKIRLRLIEDRIRLLERLRLERMLEHQPLSREQYVAEKPMDTKTFVRSIRR